MIREELASISTVHLPATLGLKALYLKHVPYINFWDDLQNMIPNTSTIFCSAIERMFSISIIR